MSDEAFALAASVVVTGARAEDLDDARFRRYRFGGYVMFDRNCSSLEALRAFTDRLRADTSPPPIVAIDQEGGRVARLREGVAPLPAAAILGRTGEEGLAHATGARCAYDLRRAGCNVNFAPVLDLALDARSAAIGDRSFGADPQVVTRMAGAFAAGLRSGGIVPTLKHFPGHGATAVDSHVRLPEIVDDEATLRARDLVPFARLVPGAEAVMAGHLLVRAFDDTAPASLSPKILRGLLRDELGFGGCCFTDDLEMGAVAKDPGSVEAASLALRAGADALTVGHDRDLAFAIVDRIAADIEAGTLPMERAREASARVLRLRARLAPPLSL